MPSSARLVRAFSRRLYGGFSFSVRLFYFFQSRLLDVFYSTFFSFSFLCPSSTIALISISTIGLLRSIKIIMQNKI